jgi:hypothetical protein
LKLCLTRTHPVRKKPTGSVSGPASQAARLEAFSVEVTMAISAERDQIFLYVVTQQASRAEVVNLETIGTAAVLASPAVTLQHFGVEFAISSWIQPKSRSSRLEIGH